jgi:hypothetical protein
VSGLCLPRNNKNNILAFKARILFMMIREEYSNVGGINPFPGMTTCQIKRATQPPTTVSSEPPSPPSYPRN